RSCSRRRKPRDGDFISAGGARSASGKRGGAGADHGLVRRGGRASEGSHRGSGLGCGRDSSPYPGAARGLRGHTAEAGEMHEVDTERLKRLALVDCCPNGNTLTLSAVITFFGTFSRPKTMWARWYGNGGQQGDFRTIGSRIVR